MLLFRQVAPSWSIMLLIFRCCWNDGTKNLKIPCGDLPSSNSTLEINVINLQTADLWLCRWQGNSHSPNLHIQRSAVRKLIALISMVLLAWWEIRISIILIHKSFEALPSLFHKFFIKNPIIFSKGELAAPSFSWQWRHDNLCKEKIYIQWYMLIHLYMQYQSMLQKCSLTLKWAHLPVPYGPELLYVTVA